MLLRSLRRCWVALLVSGGGLGAVTLPGEARGDLVPPPGIEAEEVPVLPAVPGPPAPSPAPPGVASPAAAPLQFTVLVGLLSEQFVARCTDEPGDAAVRWVFPHLEAGFVTLEPDSRVDLQPLLGRPVLLHGRVPPGVGPHRPAGGVSCRPQQMRDDMVDGRDGVRLLRGLPPGVVLPARFGVSAAAPFDGLTARRQDGELVVGVTNVTDHPWPDLVLTVHYEGCYGKPGAPSRDFRTPRLLPGESVAAHFPLLHEVPATHPVRRGRELHVPVSVQLASSSPQVALDLDLPLRLLGVRVDCPPRR